MQLDSRRSIRCTAVFTAVASCAGLVFAQPTAASPIEEPSGALATAAAHVHDSDDGCHTNCGKARMLRERFEAGLPVYDPASGEIGDREALGDTDVLHYQLEFEVFPSSQTLTGSNRITVRAVTEGVSQFTIRLRSNFTITSVTLNDVTNVPPANVASVGTYGRQIPLDRAYHANEQFTVTVGYTGVAVSRGFGSIYFGNTNAGNPIVASLSEPYYAATWWPSKDGDALESGDNIDKSTMEMSITVPDPLRAVSNGLLQGIDALSGGRSRYRWRTDFPTASYLYCFAASVYNTRTISYNYAGGSMPIEFNVYPASDTAGNRATLDLLPSMLAAYQPMYGLYPWVNEKYGVYQFPFNGGMEHQTNTGQGVFDEYVTAHELGHQWWGDNVTCRTWNDIWLNEGFATYTEALWAERKPGSSGLTALVNAMAARKPSSAAITGTVYCDDVTNLNRIFDGNLSYDKGAWVLHMLRKVLGDTTFFNCLAVYRATYERSAATTDDFIAVCESVAGRDLHWFFNKWVYSAGWPSYEYAFQSATINNKFYVRLYLHQSQNTTYGTFTMPIDLRMNRSGGSSTVTLWNDAITEHYVIPVTAPVLNVVLDEFNWILNGTKTSVTYVPGPPKVVELSPTPGAVFNPTAGPTSIRVTFSENVTTAAANFTLTRDGTPVTPSSQSYDLPNFTQVLNFSSPLPSGNYTLVVSDAVRSVAGNVQLDGETADPANVASLPTGNGQALGSATFTFRVRPPCPLDITGDFMIDLSDLAVLLSNFGVASGATGAQGDLNGDGAVDLTDLSQLLGAFGTACL